MNLDEESFNLQAQRLRFFLLEGSPHSTQSACTAESRVVQALYFAKRDCLVAGECRTSLGDGVGDVPRGELGRSRRQLILPGDQSRAGNLEKAAAGRGNCGWKWGRRRCTGS